jgi:UMF1 family MFS transporter
MGRAAHILIGHRVAFLSRIGLATKQQRAWAWYDNAESAFWATVIVAVFPPFFSDYAAAGVDATVATTRFAWTTVVAVTVMAIAAPVLGALADLRAMKKRLLALFVGIGVVSTLLMATIGEGQWIYAAVIFTIGNFAVAGGRVFYDSLLPHVATAEELDRVSTAGYAIGFLGSGLLLLLNMAWIVSPTTFGLADTMAGIRLTFVSVAVWWLLFSIPILRGVPEPPALANVNRGTGGTARLAFVGAWKAFQELRGHREAFLMLIAFLIYNDGIQTIIRMGTVYGTEVGIDRTAQIAALVLVQLIGVPCSFAFGAMADRIGPKAALYVGITVYIGIAMIGYFMTTTWHFFALASLVGMVQGGTQALSRSVFARMVPKHKSSEYFGFFSVFERFASVAGPVFFALSITLLGSSRMAVLSVIMFFAVGALVLSKVDIAKGQAQAQAIDRSVA